MEIKLRIREVTGTELGRGLAILAKIFRVFNQSFQANAGIAP
jgi:hypothetical protein